MTFVVSVEFGDESDYVVGPFQSESDAQTFILIQDELDIGSRGPSYHVVEMLSEEEFTQLREHDNDA